jgi:site-specific DNA-cytosine methylase
MTYGSVCSGIEAASVAWEPLGFKPLWFSEIEAFPSAVLAHHWPEVPNLGDMTLLPDAVRAGRAPAPDILVGGTPCQAFSIAGMRQSLDDDRGQLTLSFVRLADAIDHARSSAGQEPCVVVWENVPGVLSTADNAFGCFLGALAGSGRPLVGGEKPAAGKSNAQWRWQKPKRWRCRGRRKHRKGYHVPLWSNAGIVLGPSRAIAWRILDAQYFGVAQRRRRVFVVASARNGFDPAAVLFEFDGLRRDTAPRREAGQGATADAGRGAAGGCFWDGGQLSQTLDAVLHKGQTMPEKNRFPAVLQPAAVAHVDVMPTMVSALAVRRLTPRECERLQGFPDDHTLVPVRNKPAADGPRYKAIGNSMAVPVMRWIGERLT